MNKIESLDSYGSNLDNEITCPKKKKVPTSRFIDRDVASFVAIISKQYLLFVSLFATCMTIVSAMFLANY